MSLKRMVLSLPVGAFLFAGCTVGGSGTGTSAGPEGTTFGGSGGQGTGGTGSTGDGGTGGGLFAPGGGGESASAGTGGDGGSGGVEECAGDPYEAKLLPLDMYIMMDRSGSMGWDNNASWNAVKTAINEFVAQPADGHVGVGIGFFPLGVSPPAFGLCGNDGDCGIFGPCTGITCEHDSCSAEAYTNPAAPIAALPAGGTAVQSAISSTSPDGGTPMEPALGGAILYAQESAAANPTHVTTVVLVSDGDPDGCNSSISGVASEAAQGLAAGIQTFVVGIEGASASFEEIAVAGGTSPALIIDAGTDVTTALQAKLEEIRGSVQCSYTMPEVPVGETADFDTTNVVFTLEGTTDEIIFGRVDDASQCVPDELAYYFDNPADPTMIHLCPFACDYIANNKGEIKLTLGCEPPPEPPPPPGPG